LQHRVTHGHYQPQRPDVYFGEGVKLGENVVFDSEHGPIVIDDGVKLGHFSMLRGPVYVGPNSRISEYAAIKDKVSISHTCKIGGEIEASVIEPYSNKQHHGFLGHSYLGSWINLGAGTCNSDLKNTYGEVNADYGGRKVATGMQFFGCVMGDYAKTAINTSIFTGRLIGTASMVYGFATTNVPSFVNYARSFGELGALPPEVIVSTQRRMLARRNVDQRPCDIQLIHDMYRVTQMERPAGLSNDPPTL
jgi:glucose-1-phosphate thymidylyltransferase